jgi:methionine-rich copper-binding protein CopC
MTAFSRRVTAPILTALAFALTFAPSVLAHAALVESDPADGGSVAMPYTLVLRYDEELNPLTSSVQVRDASGNVVAEGGVSIGEDGEPEDLFTMVVGADALPLGSYQAHWIAITADDNGKTQGDLNFTVVAATPAPSETPLVTLPGSAQPTATAAQPTPTASAVVTTPAPSPINPTPPAQPSGAELILPLVLAGAVGVALVWLLLRRRTS